MLARPVCLSRAIRWGLVAGVSAAAPAFAAPDAATPPAIRTALASDTVLAFDALFGGAHSGARAVHAKGILVDGIFTPSPEAAGISQAPHFQVAPTPVVVRFSNFPGMPANADGDAHGSPRGMAIKFQLADGGETDIVAHSYNGFPAATPQKFLEFLQTVGAGDASRLAALAGREPAVRAFLDTDKPAPASYGTQAYFGVNAFLFTDAAGKARYGRYRVEPVAGEHALNGAQAAARAPDYLAADLVERLATGPVSFRLVLQLAAADDQTTDGSRPWPAERPSVTLGMLSLSRVDADQARQRTILFTPLSLVPGIAASADPMLDARTRTYRVSHDRRAPNLADAQEGGR